MNIINKILMSVSILLLAGCQNISDPSPERTNIESKQKTSLQVIENEFWNHLSLSCGKSFIGHSSFPDDVNDSFYGKTLKAVIQDCSDSEIRVPFAVGDNNSRTWIFTKTEQGIQLKHQHLHDDGTPDEVSNYGGMGSDGESALIQAGVDNEMNQVTLSFPADQFTQELIPAASTNVWSITFLSKPNGEYNGITYYLTRHGEPRFKALLMESQ